MPDSDKTAFESEADMCAYFIAALPGGWRAYPETGGFDILLAHDDGWQIGVEAKMTLNAKVLAQALPGVSRWRINVPQPDYRAVLVPSYATQNHIGEIARHVWVTVIRVFPPISKSKAFGHIQNFHKFQPYLPHSKLGDSSEDGWYDRCPHQRLLLPDYVPDVAAGASAPSRLTSWKIGAIKISIILQKRGYVTAEDFAKLRISTSLWSQNGWIVKGAVRKMWRAGNLPDFRRQHPVNYAQIEADWDKWSAEISLENPMLAALANEPPQEQKGLL